MMWKTAAFAALLGACATTRPESDSGARDEERRRAESDLSERFSDERPPPRATDEEIRDFNRVWELYRRRNPRWPQERDRLKARSEACGYLLAAHMLRFYEQLNAVRQERFLELRAVMREVVAIGEPCVPYLADWMVLDRIPTRGPGGKTVYYVPDDLTKKDCLEMLEAIGAPAAPMLLRVLERKDLGERGRRMTATALGATRDVRALEPLARLLKEDAEWTVRADAAGALGRLGDRRALPFLADAARADPDPAVRKRAEKARSEIIRASLPGKPR